MRRPLLFAAVATVVVSFVATIPGGVLHAQSGSTVPFKEADLKVEVNATDGDAGLQVFLDHEPWRSIVIKRPDRSEIFNIETRGVLRDYGLTELFSESSEPPFNVFPLAKFRKLFPEGLYTFVGETIDGVKMKSKVPLTHDFPDGPEIVSPEDGSTVPFDDVVVRWEPVTGLGIVGYQVVVTKEGPLRVLEATLPGTATKLRIPKQFMEPGTVFKAEVLAIETSGNQTLTEVEFTTS